MTKFVGEMGHGPENSGLDFVDILCLGLDAGIFIKNMCMHTQVGGYTIYYSVAILILAVYGATSAVV